MTWHGWQSSTIHRVWAVCVWSRENKEHVVGESQSKQTKEAPIPHSLRFFSYLDESSLSVPLRSTFCHSLLGEGRALKEVLLLRLIVESLINCTHLHSASSNKRHRWFIERMNSERGAAGTGEAHHTTKRKRQQKHCSRVSHSAVVRKQNAYTIGFVLR